MEQVLQSYRLSQVFEPLPQAEDLLVLVRQEHQQVVLLLLGLLHLGLQLRLLRLQDGDRAGGGGQLQLQLRPALRPALGISLERKKAQRSERRTTETRETEILPRTLSVSISVSCAASRLSSSAILAASAEPSSSGADG